ncbi:cell division cycle protein [Histoplasma capsulatum]|uniref:Cell division cycle protein n=1 Tax=Ajellomyces capsulatus TaxID=5037 RepID=A0A8A1MQ28_AJECA|nr:cell division cycle protein [Histoplasma capsulatum]
MAADGPKFTVRPLSKQPRNDQKDSFRVSLSPSSLLLVKARPGDLCRLESAEGPQGTAIAWASAERIPDTVVQTSKAVQDLYGLKLGEKISIYREHEPLDEISAVRLEECTDASKISAFGALLETDRPHWEWGLEYPLIKCEIIAEGMVFDLDLRGNRRTFKVVEIEPLTQSRSNTIFQFTSRSKVSIGQALRRQPLPSSLVVSPTGLGGLGQQVMQINERLRDFTFQEHNVAMPSFYRNSGGILIYGPKGTGKSTLLSKLGAAGWKKVLTVNSSVLNRNRGDGEVLLRKIFTEALQSQPCLIAIDQLDYLAPKNRPNDSSICSALCEALDSLQDAKVLVAACTRHPNDVDDNLRTPHRFGVEIELPVPTAKGREEILLSIRGTSNVPNDHQLAKLAERTHGYVGADLFSLLQLSCRKAQTRQILQLEQGKSCSSEQHISGLATPSESGAPDENFLQIDDTDISLALQETRPTAMREVFLETPKVKWSDIGGLHEIKERLRKAVERPLKFPDRMKRLNISGKKGILLYGPPGCSKTLMVKALATEAGLNFLAVKGAEILSMYVGESERALREIFRKARSASPSIIFFDEIDAIASRRGSSAVQGGGGGINVLTTLLNEMDGIEELKNVLVVAATNKPEVLDPALMRPGRLDNILYIGPPDVQARKEILNIWISKSEVDDDVDIDMLAEVTEGYSGAEMVNICETAADSALDEEEETGRQQRIGWRHFESALDQVPRQISSAVIQGYERWRDDMK